MNHFPGTPALPVIAIRPQPGLSATVDEGRALGLDIRGFALFAGEPVAWQLPATDDYAGLLVGSAALFRLGGQALERLRSLPVHAVGAATAAVAGEAGFDVRETGEGGLDAIVAHLQPGRYLRLAGEAHVPLHPAPGVTIDTRVVYRMAALAMPPALVALLAGPALVLLHSGEAARHFVAQCDSNAIDHGNVALAALAPRIAEAAGSGWAEVRVAPDRTDRALLALAQQMCESGAGSLGKAQSGRSCQTTT